MTTLVFFDLDGTITRGVSSENAFILALIKRRYLGFKQYFRGVQFILQKLTQYKKHVFIKDKAYLSGLDVDKISQFGEALVRDKLLKQIRPDLLKRIEAHRQAGDKIFLITGSPTFLATVFAKQLNIPDVYATECAQERGRFCHFPPVQHPFGAEKLKIAQEICAEHKEEMTHCVAYGNSINDQYILSAVGQAVAVNPDRMLRKLAKKNHWEIID